MYERNYATDPRVLGEENAKQETRIGAIAGREVPMAETMNRLMQVISSIDDAVNALDQRTGSLRQPSPVSNTKDARPERAYSPLVGTINDQVTRLERLHLNIRQITSELEI